MNAPDDRPAPTGAAEQPAQSPAGPETASKPPSDKRSSGAASIAKVAIALFMLVLGLPVAGVVLLYAICTAMGQPNFH